MENTKKIQICNDIQRVTSREECPPMFNKLGAGPNCIIVSKGTTDTVCSEPAATVSEANASLDLKLLEVGKTVPGLKQSPVGGKFFRFCSLIHAARVERWVVTGEGESARQEPLLHREQHEVCGEGKTLSEAEANRTLKAVEFATQHPYLRYRNLELQKVAEKEAERIRNEPVSHDHTGAYSYRRIY